jgi:integration host factor subunit alpha
MVKKNFTKKDLSIKIYQKLGFSKNFSSLIIDDFFEAINSELIKANKIKLSSFGTLKILSKKERRGRNPKTKSEALISARKVVSFKPSSLFKNKINKT